MALVNWWIAGGTLRRWYRTARWRWSLTYLGHLTNLERSRPAGRMSPPTWNVRGRAGKRGSAALTTLGFSSAAFFDLLPFFGA
jgi:hypothetical protein